MPSKIPDGGQRGWIIPIGGAEEKEDRPEILRRFVALCGGADANIVVIPSEDLVIVRRGEDPAGGSGFDIVAFTRDVLAALAD